MRLIEGSDAERCNYLLAALGGRGVPKLQAPVSLLMPPQSRGSYCLHHPLYLVP